MKKTDKKAFTLIELIVVIAVVGILVLLGAPRFTGHTQRAELTRIQHDVKVMEQEIGAMLINKDDDFNKWESNSKDFNQLIQESKLFDREGDVEKIEDLSIDKIYKVIPEKYKDKINTKLKGTFYANSGGKVYYEHIKPLVGKSNGPENPAEPEEEDDNPIPIGEPIDFDYTGQPQSIELEKGSYKLEVWGAQGGYNTGGKGGYSSGILSIPEQNTLHVYVGQKGKSGTTTRDKSFNGGGFALSPTDVTRGHGGGASDIRLIGGSWNDTSGLYSRIIVAGGGGGGYINDGKTYYGGEGGGTNGLSPRIYNKSSSGKGGTQTSGGMSSFSSADNQMHGTFGIGGDGTPRGLSYILSGGGGGWYGGGGGNAGGGGSSYTLTENSHKPSGYNVSEEFYLDNTELIPGNQSIPNPNGGTMAGNNGHGFVRITRVNYSNGEIQGLIPEGSEGSITIATADELAKIGKTGYPLSGKYILTANIDLSGYSKEEGWNPIGKSNSRFTGSFDGNGYKITGLTINRPETNNVGLFGYTEGATISNVALEGINITGKDYVGGLVGQAGRSTDTQGTTISNSYATGSVTGKSGAGGLVGYADRNTTISNSYATVEVTGSGGVGGLVGTFAGDMYTTSRGTISNSYATGSVTGLGSVGGLVGGSTNSTIENSYATGQVTGLYGSERVGGFVGSVSYIGRNIITNSYATGKVIGGKWVGGFAGFTNAGTISKSYATGEVIGTGDNVGGFLGKALGGTINNSYATGSVKGISYVGGFAGWAEYRAYIKNSYATGKVTGREPTSSRKGGVVGGFIGYVDGSGFPVSNSYWNTKTSELEESTGYYRNSSRDGVEGKTTDEMKLEETYSDWDFETIWKIDEGNDYPKLR